MAVAINELEKAKNALAQALAMEHTDIVRDASIQRFEFCVELSWKVLKKIMGTSSVAPRAVIREAAQQGLIPNPKTWLKHLDARNLTSHTHNETTAQNVFQQAQLFLPDLEELVSEIKKF